VVPAQDQQQKPPEHLLEDQVQQSDQQGGGHARPSPVINHRWSAACAAFWNPTGQFAASFDGVMADAGVEVVKISRAVRSFCLAVLVS
jgi:hypothetical protein